MISSNMDPLGAPSRKDFTPQLRQYKPHQGFPLNFPKASLLLVAWYLMMVTDIISSVVRSVNSLSEIVQSYLSAPDIYR